MYSPVRWRRYGTEKEIEYETSLTGTKWPNGHDAIQLAMSIDDQCAYCAPLHERVTNRMNCRLSPAIDNTDQLDQHIDAVLLGAHMKGHTMALQLASMCL